MSGAFNSQIRIINSILNIKPDSWRELQAPDFPFVDYEFLSSLEATHCLGERTGWAPVYVTTWNNERLTGALVLFAKDNSYGEFIFDFGWADAAYNAGINYYPKLVSAIPFTPVTGSKFLINFNCGHDEREGIKCALLEASKEIMKSAGMSSVHHLFIPQNEMSFFKNQGFFVRNSFQYHWANRNYENFDSFLQSLTGKRRREVVRERSQVAKQGVRIVQLTGEQLTQSHAEIMHSFYQNTMDKKQGFEFLTGDFFKMVFEKMKNKIHLVLAYHNDQPVAGALNFIGKHRLFGRYWGCRADYRALHFEVCYYQGIDYCIERKLPLFEAGAQGEHKFQRGFLPTLTYSAHQIVHPGLGQAITDFVEREKKQLELVFADYDEHSPYQ